jgi:hypothetical protein
MDSTECRDLYEILTDPVRAQSAVDRFTSNSYDLVIEGESYRRRLKPRLKTKA